MLSLLRAAALATCSALLLLACQSAADGPSGSDPSGDDPFAWARASDTLHLVGEGALSRPGENTYGTAFTPSGDTVFFNTTDRGDGTYGVAMSVRSDSGWSTPTPAPFETEPYEEAFPSITPDGNVVFSSKRPDRPGAPERDTRDFFYTTRASGFTDITRMTFTDAISEMRGGVAEDGTVYYWTYASGEGMGFYRGQIDSNRQIRDTVNADPMLFPDAGGENNPYVDPQKRFIVFAMYGREDGLGREDLYLATRDGDAWAPPIHLGPAVNSRGNDTHPYVTPDGSKLFLTSTRLTSPADTSDNWNHFVIQTDAVPALKEVLRGGTF